MIAVDTMKTWSISDSFGSWQILLLLGYYYFWKSEVHFLKMLNVPCWQFLPEYPAWHLHLYPPVRSRSHTPPCWQGLSLQLVALKTKSNQKGIHSWGSGWRSGFFLAVKLWQPGLESSLVHKSRFQSLPAGVPWILFYSLSSTSKTLFAFI